MPVKVYRYSAIAPRTNGTLVREQLLLAHRYRNKLVELERARRERVAVATRQHFPRLLELDETVAEAKQQVVALEEAIKVRNAAARRRTATPADRAALKLAKEQRKAVYDEHKALRAEAYGPEDVTNARRMLAKLRKNDPDNQFATAAAEKALQDAETAWYARLPAALTLRQEMDQIDTDAKVAHKAARAECQLYWGTYLQVEETMRDARKGSPPDFRSCPRDERGQFAPEGKVAVQLQHGLTVPELLAADDTRLRVERDPQSPSGNLRHHICQLRIGSEGRQPIFAEVPFQLSRPLPADSVIKLAFLMLRRIGPREEWTVQFVVESQEGFERPERAEGGTVALDLGWRLLGDGSRRVAYWLGTDGMEGELIMPEGELSRWDHVEHLQSVRDTLFNQGRDVLACWSAGSDIPPALAQREEWLRCEGARDNDSLRRERRHQVLLAEADACAALRADFTAPDLPEWFREETTALQQWRSAARLERVLVRWRNERFPGDERIFPVLEGWRKNDKHLWAWMASAQTKAQRWRKDAHRKFALEMMRRYRRIIVPHTDWRTFLTAQAVGSEGDANQPRPAKIAAVGELVTCLKAVAGEFRKVPALNITRQCHVCERIDAFDSKTELRHKCRHCGNEWDQSRNACVNLLRASGQVVNELLGIAR